MGNGVTVSHIELKKGVDYHVGFKILSKGPKKTALVVNCVNISKTKITEEMQSVRPMKICRKV